MLIGDKLFIVNRKTLSSSFRHDLLTTSRDTNYLR